MRARSFLFLVSIASINAVAKASGHFATGATSFLPKSRLATNGAYSFPEKIRRRSESLGLEEKESLSSENALSSVCQLVRGGAGPFKGESVAKFATLITICNAALISLAPAKTLKMYGLDESPLAEYMTECLGNIITSHAITQWSLNFNNNSINTAMGAGTLYLTIFTLKSLLNDMPSKLGFPAFGQCIFLAINIFCGYTLLYNKPQADNVAKYYPLWGLVNALSFILAPDAMGRKWGVEGDEPNALVTYVMKQTGLVLASKAVYLLSLGNGVDPIKALGYGNIPALLGMIMTNFVTKEIDQFGMDQNEQWVWLLLKVFIVGSLVF
mmetsp:Transcript_22067/g.37848  ORF Transcript_22067/g.37848 Transcript_22067/m.37848 type:complete len:326 (+) Transcript_22067:77-1054(+)